MTNRLDFKLFTVKCNHNSIHYGNWILETTKYLSYTLISRRSWNLMLVHKLKV